MTATYEEALEQGWLEEPSSTFFGSQAEEARIFFGKCHNSPWVLMRRTEPVPVLMLEHPAVQQALRHFKTPEKIPSPLKNYLPTIEPRPRPATYVLFADYRR